MAASPSVCYMEAVIRGQQHYRKLQSVFLLCLFLFPVVLQCVFCNTEQVTAGQLPCTNELHDTGECRKPFIQLVAVGQVFFLSVVFIFQFESYIFSNIFPFPIVSFNVAFFLCVGAKLYTTCITLTDVYMQLYMSY